MLKTGKMSWSEVVFYSLDTQRNRLRSVRVVVTVLVVSVVWGLKDKAKKVILTSDLTVTDQWMVNQG